MERFPKEEHRTGPQWWLWSLVISAAAFAAAYGFVAFFIIDEAPRRYDYPVLPSAPGESIYSTRQPPYAIAEPPPRQILALPEGKPWKRDIGYDPNELTARERLFAHEYVAPSRPPDAGASQGPVDAGRQAPREAGVSDAKPDAGTAPARLGSGKEGIR